MFSNGNSGLVGGIGLIVTTLGFVVTLWALRVTYLQLIRTKTAAEAVSEATNKLKSRTSFFDVALETTKASKSLENVLTHLRAGSWQFASQNLWDAQVSLNRILPTITSGAERIAVETAVRSFRESVRVLEESADRNLHYDSSTLTDLIRQQIILVDSKLVSLQRNIYDE